MAWGQKKPRGTRTIDKFAQALSETDDVQAAARQLELNPDYARSLFSQIQFQLGREQCR